MKKFQDIHSKVDFDSISFKECIDSKYIQTKRMSYIENGKQKVWDIVNSHDSVSILIYDNDLDSFIIVRQFRPAVYVKNNNGYTYELCAGLVDKEGKNLKTIASEEVLEECGYKVFPSKLEEIGVFYSSTGLSGGKQTIFFVEVTQKDRITNGGGIDDECIEVLSLKLDDVKDFLQDSNISKTTGLGYALKWFFDTKRSK